MYICAKFGACITKCTTGLLYCYTNESFQYFGYRREFGDGSNTSIKLYRFLFSSSVYKPNLRSLSAYGKDDNFQSFSLIYVALFPIALYPSDNEETTQLHIAQDVVSLRIYIN